MRILFLFILFFSSSFSSDINIIKNGIFNFNKTLTIGQAFDNWKSCKEIDWMEYKKDNGVRTVTFICEHKNIVPYSKKVSTFYPNEDQRIFDLISYATEFEFTINVDDTFQLGQVLRTIDWGDDKFAVIKENKGRILKQLYANYMLFELKEIANKKIAGIVYSKLFEYYKYYAKSVEPEEGLQE